jgi:hypothetical protein
VLLQTLLPLLPATLLAAACGTAGGYLLLSDLDLEFGPPVGRLLAVVGIALGATAAVTAGTLPLLRRSVRPGELRFE